jgi:hypothetical protein
MLSAKINTLTTSQDAPAYVWHHTKHAHGPALKGDGYAVVHVKLPKTGGHFAGFPVDYHVSITPEQPGIVASVTNKSADGFDVVLTPIKGSFDAGAFSVM